MINLHFNSMVFTCKEKSRRLKSEKETVIILDFGGQYNQLIARRVRESDVYCEVLPYTTRLDKIREIAPKGIIFTGGSASVYEAEAPICDQIFFLWEFPS